MTVFLVEDDQSVAHAISYAARFMGLKSELYESAEHFLGHYEVHRPGCLILDFQLPGLNGLDLQKQLVARGNLLPIIMISGHGTIAAAVEAMELGALTFLEKPFELSELRREIDNAIQLNAAARREAADRDEVDLKIRQLTEKELEVFEFVAKGKANKEIAKELGISVRAVEDRRSRMMRKLNAEYLSDVIRIASKASKPCRLPTAKNGWPESSTTVRHNCLLKDISNR